jgi:PKD repeat protein
MKSDQIMKRILRYTLYTLLPAITLTACREQNTFESIVEDGEKPVAAFSYVARTMTVTFTDNSERAESYFWSFGDGTTSTEASPEHTYTMAGYYVISLKVNSRAGYSDVSESEPVFVASSLETAFSSVPELGFSVFFDARASKNIVSAQWDFGDGQTGEGLTTSHAFPSEGVYIVRIKATGLLGDTDEYEKEITVFKNMNLLKGSNMEGDAGEYWIIMAEGMSMKFGYASDKPSTGEGGCLRFAGVNENTNSLIYQGVRVEAGKKYKLSAQIKVPVGAKNAYLQFYISRNADSAGDFIESSGDPNTNHFLCLNSWNGWGDNDNGTTAFDGDLYQAVTLNGYYGLGALNGGIYTATETTIVYIGIKVFTQVLLGDVLVDSVLFELQD